MTLDEFLKPKGAQLDLSRRLGVTKGRMSQLSKADEWPPELALKAEEATDGALDAAALSSIIARARQAAA